MFYLTLRTELAAARCCCLQIDPLYAWSVSQTEQLAALKAFQCAVHASLAISDSKLSNVLLWTVPSTQEPGKQDLVVAVADLGDVPAPAPFAFVNCGMHHGVKLGAW